MSVHLVSQLKLDVGRPFVMFGVCALVGLSAVLVAGCGSGESGRPDAGIRGPEGGTLTFDAAMLDDPDSAMPPPADTGVRDTGVRDTGVRDTGVRDTGTSTGVCTGYARSCSVLTDTECLDALGCSLDSTCEGYASSCYSQYSSYTCNSQRGCYWSSYSSDCSGSAWSCSLLSSSECYRQRGCSTSRRCTGVSRSCSSLTLQYLCDSQPGCTYEYR